MPRFPTRLSTVDHDRDAMGLRYVYAVVSRRAGGVSVGINLNPNNACNWRCIYCQVPNLTMGAAPEIDLDRLQRELRGLLDDIQRGDLLEKHAPPESRRLCDVAFSGNGEPTASPQFAESVDRVGAVLGELGLIGKIKIVLITNGSLLSRPPVRRGVERLAALGGEVWFKLDAVTAKRRRLVNSTPLPPEHARENLAISASVCPTRIQTCLFGLDGEPPPADEQDAYLEFIGALRRDGVPIRDVVLYGVERESHQPEAPRIRKLEPEWFEQYAGRIRALGLPVEIHR